jgi:hypothetical protein
MTTEHAISLRGRQRPVAGRQLTSTVRTPGMVTRRGRNRPKAAIWSRVSSRLLCTPVEWRHKKALL